MKKILTCLPLILLVAFSFSSYGQYPPINYAVRITATVKEIPPSITLKWDLDTSVASYTLYRKSKKMSNWNFLESLTKSDSTYTDTKVIADSAYEYRITSVALNANPTADGYIYAGIKLHSTDYRGKLLLVIDSTFIDSLALEVNQLMEDISADGWAVMSHYVSRKASPQWVKQYIYNQYIADSQNVKGLFLLGHVPVPYSGSLNPDGHPQHLGAWPADAYYGDIHGTYTDIYAWDTASDLAYAATRNVPGDGKFDQSIIPGQVLLQMGRVDLSYMDSFPKTETQLMQQYLHRDHDYRFKNFTMVQRGLISDNFYTYGEGFASDAWRNFPPMFSDTGVHTGGYFPTLTSQNYLWSYGCGGGNNEGAGGIGSTIDYVHNSLQTVFTMMFGSFFGDWNQPDNFLRAPLASEGLVLTAAWGGRPMWFFHHMAMGETVGYGTMITQNNGYYYPYYPSYGARFINIALMGDPTLRQHTITPPLSVTHTIPVSGYGVSISWENSPDTVAGYYVYRSKTRFGEYDRVSASILTAPPFIDNPKTSGLYYYYVKAVKWEHSPSGNYLNTSEGINDSVTEAANLTAVAQVEPAKDGFLIYPNPASESTAMLWQNAPIGQYDVNVKDELGRTIYYTKVNVTEPYSSIPFSVKEFSAGCYYIEASCNANHFVQKLVVGK